MTVGPFLVAVDGGQTATKALIARRDGAILGAGRGGPSDHFHGAGGIEKNRQAIQEAVAQRSTPSGAGAGRCRLDRAGVDRSASGRRADANRRRNRPRDSASRYRHSRARLRDKSGRAPPAGEPGVVLIAGGGSIGFGVTADGREALAGGFGYLLGDEGSAFDIGLRAIAAACRAEDRRGEATSLTAIVLEHFAIPTMRVIPRVVYRAGFSREQISLLAPAVSESARTGDVEARRIMASAGEEFARNGARSHTPAFHEGRRGHCLPDRWGVQCWRLPARPLSRRASRRMADCHVQISPFSAGGRGLDPCCACPWTNS